MPKTILLLVFVVLVLGQASTSYGLPINLEDFESYANHTELQAVWKAKNSDTMWIFLHTVNGHESDQSMDCFCCYEPPYYCAEVDANLSTLGAEPNWLGTGAKALSLWLWFEGNDPNVVMYIKLTDSGEPPQSAKVMYDGNLQEFEGGMWYECNFDLQEFAVANPSFDLRKVEQITIGFGDGNNVCCVDVLIDDIRLYGTRCVLSKRSSDFAKVDYAPLRVSGYGGGDCVVDNQELEIMANTFIIKWYPPIHPNSIPNLVAYWSMNEGTGNTILTDPYDPCYTGTFSASGVSWVTPGIIDTGSALHFDGSDGARVNCGNKNPASEANELTLAVWVKWAGPHANNGQGLISKRTEWSASGVMFMFEVDTYREPRGTFGLRQFGLADTDVFAPAGLLTECTGEWVHLAATYDGTDSNDACKLYLNGNEVASGPFRFGGGTSAGLVIGNDVDAIGWPNGPESFKGDLDEACIFNRALTAEEIAYLVGYIIEEPGIIAMPSPPANFYQECAGCPIVINFMDYAVLAEYWLQEQMWP